MCNRCKLPMYKYDQRKYFNWAAGIRATDKHHAIAQRYFERMKKLTDEGKTRQIAGEGLEISNEVRTLLSCFLGCNPRNIIFGNSATLSTLPLFLAFYRSGNKYGAIFLPHDYSLFDGLIFDHRTNLTSNVPRNLSWNMSKLLEQVTRQNYGQRRRSHKVCRAVQNRYLIRAWRNLEIEAVLNCDKHSIVQSINDLFFTKMAMLADGFIPLLFFDQFTRFGENSEPFASELFDMLRSSRHFNKGYKITDISHSFGVCDLTSSELGDVVVGGSSKALGAEPTVGFMYVSDELLELLQRVYIGNEQPFSPIAFQFHQEIDKQHNKNAESVSNTPFWISLPELESFKCALIDLKSTKIENLQKSLEAVKSNLLDKMRRFSTITGDSLEYVSHNGMNMKFFILDGLPSFICFDLAPTATINTDSDTDLSTKLRALRKEGRGDLAEAICVSLAEHQFLLKQRQVHLLETHLSKRGYSVKVLESNYTLNPRRSCTLRISFRHDVEQDVDGLLNVLEDVLKKERVQT